MNNTSKTVLQASVLIFSVTSSAFAVYEDHYYESYQGGEYTEIATNYDGSVGGDPDYFGSISGGFFNGGIARPGYDVSLSNLNSAKVYTGLLPDGSFNAYGTQIVADSYDGVRITMNTVSTLEYANAGILSSVQQNAVNIIDSTSTNSSVSISNSGTITSTFGGINYASANGAGQFSFVNQAGGILDADTSTFALQVQKAAAIRIENYGSMSGNVNLVGDNLTFVSKAGAVNNFNNLAMSDNVVFEFEITDKDSVGTVNATGLLNLPGAINLDFDLSGASLDVGDTLGLFLTTDNIGSSFFRGTTEIFDGDSFWVGNYEFSFALNSNDVSVTVTQVIPEPSSYALISGASLLCFASLRRRRKTA